MQTFRYFLDDWMDPSPMMSDRDRSLKKHVFLSNFRTHTNAKSSKVASNFPILPMIGDLSVTDRQTDRHRQTHRQTNIFEFGTPLHKKSLRDGLDYTLLGDVPQELGLNKMTIAHFVSR